MGASTSIDYIPPRHIHISYPQNSPNFKIVQHLREYLVKNGLTVTDHTNILDNQSMISIQKCDIMMICMDKNSIFRDYQQVQDSNSAKEYGKKIVYLDLEPEQRHDKYLELTLRKQDYFPLSKNSDLINIEDYLRNNFAEFIV